MKVDNKILIQKKKKTTTASTAAKKSPRKNIWITPDYAVNVFPSTALAFKPARFALDCSKEALFQVAK